MNSEEVQSQIQAGVAKAQAGRKSLQALKTQLDSYNTFYQGVLSYTAGVDQANEGAQQILAGTYTLGQCHCTVIELFNTVNKCCTAVLESTNALEEALCTVRK